MGICPDHPEREQKAATKAHGISMSSLEHLPKQDQVADCLEEWFVNLNLPMDKRLIFLTQNGLFDIPFIKHWLGQEMFDRFFCWIGRDTMQYALGLNDQAAFKCQPVPFPNGVGLKSLAATLGVELLNHHDALADSIATARVYKEMLRLEV
jgi:DNA polymerase III epsilon subunit-like protein